MLPVGYSRAANSVKVKAKVDGWKKGAQQPVHIAMNARNWLKRMRKRRTLCQAESLRGGNVMKDFNVSFGFGFGFRLSFGLSFSLRIRLTREPPELVFQKSIIHYADSPDSL